MKYVFNEGLWDAVFGYAESSSLKVDLGEIPGCKSVVLRFSDSRSAFRFHRAGLAASAGFGHVIGISLRELKIFDRLKVNREIDATRITKFTLHRPSYSHYMVIDGYVGEDFSSLLPLLGFSDYSKISFIKSLFHDQEYVSLGRVYEDMCQVQTDYSNEALVVSGVSDYIFRFYGERITDKEIKPTRARLGAFYLGPVAP